MRKICIFLALVTLAFSCGVKEKKKSNAKDYMYFSECDTYIHLANDTLSQNRFSIGWGMGRHRLLTMAVSNTVYTVYRHPKVRNPVLNGMPINNVTIRNMPTCAFRLSCRTLHPKSNVQFK